MNKETYKQRIIDFPNESKECPLCHESKLLNRFRWCARICKDCEYQRDKASLKKSYLNRREAYLTHRKKTDQANPKAYLISYARQRARVKGLPFSICAEDISIPEYCPILGIKLSNVRDNSPESDKASSPSLDKIVDKLGYVKGNVQVISYRANTLKNNATIAELEKVLDYLKSVQGQDPNLREQSVSKGESCAPQDAPSKKVG